MAQVHALHRRGRCPHLRLGHDAADQRRLRDQRQAGPGAAIDLSLQGHLQRRPEHQAEALSAPAAVDGRDIDVCLHHRVRRERPTDLHLERRARPGRLHAAARLDQARAGLHGPGHRGRLRGHGELQQSAQAGRGAHADAQRPATPGGGRRDARPHAAHAGRAHLRADHAGGRQSGHSRRADRPERLLRGAPATRGRCRLRARIRSRPDHGQDAGGRCGHGGQRGRAGPQAAGRAYRQRDDSLPAQAVRAHRRAVDHPADPAAGRLLLHRHRRQPQRVRVLLSRGHRHLLLARRGRGAVPAAAYPIFRPHGPDPDRAQRKQSADRARQGQQRSDARARHPGRQPAAVRPAHDPGPPVLLVPDDLQFRGGHRGVGRATAADPFLRHAEPRLAAELPPDVHLQGPALHPCGRRLQHQSLDPAGREQHQRLLGDQERAAIPHGRSHRSHAGANRHGQRGRADDVRQHGVHAGCEPESSGLPAAVPRRFRGRSRRALPDHLPPEFRLQRRFEHAGTPARHHHQPARQQCRAGLRRTGADGRVLCLVPGAGAARPAGSGGCGKSAGGRVRGRHRPVRRPAQHARQRAGHALELAVGHLRQPRFRAQHASAARQHRQPLLQQPGRQRGEADAGQKTTEQPLHRERAHARPGQCRLFVQRRAEGADPRLQPVRARRHGRRGRPSGREPHAHQLYPRRGGRGAQGKLRQRGRHRRPDAGRAGAGLCRGRVAERAADGQRACRRRLSDGRRGEGAARQLCAGRAHGRGDGHHPDPGLPEPAARAGRAGRRPRSVLRRAAGRQSALRSFPADVPEPAGRDGHDADQREVRRPASR